MFYEIPREIFKQKLLDRTNVQIIQIGDQQGHDYKDIDQIKSPFDADAFLGKYPNKALTYVFFGFDQSAMDAKKAAESLSLKGYPFVFFYQGAMAKDRVLDKGIN